MKTIYVNGQVYTGSLPLKEAFVEEDGKFVAVGDNNSVASYEGNVVDLKGQFVMAGFNDSHMHLLSYGNNLRVALLGEHTKNLKDVVACLKEFEASHPEGWVIGRGWNQDYFNDEHRMPTRQDLDEVSTSRPVLATRCCGHALVVNSYIMDMLKEKVNDDIEGGHIDIANGQFFDNAMSIVYDEVPAPTKAEIKEMIELASHALNSFGVTSSQSDDYCVFRNVDFHIINESYQELEAEGKLTVRVYEQANFTNLEDYKRYLDEKNEDGTYFKHGPLKMLGDGSLGARTAFMSEPYADDPTTTGLPVFSQETLDEMIGYAHHVGKMAAVHAIGDACLDRVLNAMEKAMTTEPKAHRHGIVHCQISRPDQLERIARLGLHVYAQSIFLDYDTNIVEDRVGKQRAASSYAWKTLKDKGVLVSNGTDCPVELPYALGGIQCAITRESYTKPNAPYLPHEAFSVEEALNTYSVEGAYASFEENVKGQIKEGYLADFVILAENPFEIDPHHIKDIKVVATYLNGQKVYE